MDPTLIPSDGSAAERPEETGGGLALDPEAEPSAVRLDALLTADPKFRRSWGQDRKDQSPTAYNLSLATMAMGVGWSDQEVVNLLICWRRKHGHDLKLGEGYYEIILSKAKEPIVMAQAQEQLEEALLLRPEDQSEVLKANLKTLFRVDIIRIVKYVGEPPVYYMYTKQGDITLGEISSITSQTKFQNLVAAATDVWIPAVSRKAWDQRIQAILLVCEPIDVGDASHLAQETNAWLEEYLLKKPPREEDEWLKAAEAKQPFILHGKVHIFLDDFQKWLELNTGEQATSHALGRRLRQCQAQDGEDQREAGKLLDLSHHLATARENTMPNRSRKSRRPDPSSSSFSTTRGILEKKISIFSKKATGLLGSPIFRFLF